MTRSDLRKSKIACRNALSIEERDDLSRKIAARIFASKEFQEAQNVMIYKGVRGEVRLEMLEAELEAQYFEVDQMRMQIVEAKKLLYPLCISNTEMIALYPEDKEAWKAGYCGIPEPVRERSEEIAPEDIDLVICPCTVFDEQGGRMGMGAGFYDRYLEKCTNAVVAAVAFECQKTDSVPVEAWDKPMDLIFTEETIYRPLLR